MALWETMVDVVGGSWLGTAAVGVGVVLVAPLVLPVVGAGLREVTKMVVKGGLLAVAGATAAVAVAGEQGSELWAEAYAEVHPEAGPDLGTPGPRVAEREAADLVDAYGQKLRDDGAA